MDEQVVGAPRGGGATGGAGDWPDAVTALDVPEPVLAEAVALTHAAAERADVGDPTTAAALRLEALGVLGRRLPDLLALELEPGPLDAAGVAAVVADLLEACLGRPGTLLATYGSLRPGGANHEVVADLAGTWAPGTLHGRVVDWEGYPVLQWQRGGAPVAASLLRADALVGAWDRLDRFEGPRYRRRPVLAEVDGGWVVATAYVDAHHHPAEHPSVDGDTAPGARAT